MVESNGDFIKDTNSFIFQDIFEMSVLRSFLRNLYENVSITHRMSCFAENCLQLILFLTDSILSMLLFYHISVASSVFLIRRDFLSHSVPYRKQFCTIFFGYNDIFEFLNTFFIFWNIVFTIPMPSEYDF